MATTAQIRQFLRAARDAAAVGSPERRAYRNALRAVREGADVVSDLADAWAYLAGAAAAPATIDAGEFAEAWTELRSALPTLTWSNGGGRNVRAVRNGLRALMVNVATPPAIATLCEQWKRTNLLDQDNAVPPNMKFDQQATDPIEVAVDAALLLPAPTTEEGIATLFTLLQRYKELSPDQPPAA